MLLQIAHNPNAKDPKPLFEILKNAAQEKDSEPQGLDKEGLERIKGVMMR